MRYIITVLAIATAIMGYKIYDSTSQKDVKFGTSNLTIVKQNGQSIKLKAMVADTIGERAQGLMGVEKLGENESMLFIFPHSEQRRMWMENTLIPLDMLFVSNEKEIFNFSENTVPLSRDLIHSVGPAMYVVEVNAGFVKKHGIKRGDRIEFEIIN